MSYEKFLAAKRLLAPPAGLTSIPELHEELFPFQRDIVAWALRRGKAAIFADCGLGKTLMQLEWARQVPGSVLILTPLAVAHQTIREGARFGIEAGFYKNKTPDDCKIIVANYESLHKLDLSVFNAVVLDESSILKSFDGATRTLLIDSFAQTPYKLCCTATPAPNDFMELGNHAEFLGTMTRGEMLSMFFVHDGGDTSKWRIKGHAQKPFWEWVCSWAVNIRKPSDLGDSDKGFILPKLNIKQETVTDIKPMEGFLFAMPAASLDERLQARRETVKERAEMAAAIVMREPEEQWLIWCKLNSESEKMVSLLPQAKQITGSDSPESKEQNMRDFTDGKIRVLVTKPSIAGFGMNWQNCSRVIFLGLSDSYEEFYQALRRCWRFGQKSEVDAYIVIAENEGAVLKNIQRKEADADKMANEMVQFMSEITKKNIKGTVKTTNEYKEGTKDGKGFTMHLGDCVEQSRQIESGSIDFSIFSPPFASLYTYSNSERDMGNCKDYETFCEHFGFLIKELFRVTKDGRLCSFHCMNLPTTKTHHGYIGVQDFRGHLIRSFQEAGWIYHSEVCIWKDPVTAMQRTKALGLLHKQLKKDSCMSRQGIPDYLVTMRKPGENAEPVTHTNETFPVQVWQKYASPIWMDINPSDTLQFRAAREHEDEKHICPLQLQVIQRALELWTNPGDLVLSPFAGIGSEGYMSLKLGRRFVGIELKQSYFDAAVKNLRSVVESSQGSIFQLEQEALSY